MYDTRSFMPPQRRPIDRTPAGEAAFISQAGVDASGLGGWLKRHVLPQVPTAIKIARMAGI
jgi:hypothetical protein